jgi:hypothetical protein
LDHQSAVEFQLDAVDDRPAIVDWPGNAYRSFGGIQVRGRENFLSRKIGDLLQALFGWSIAGLFGLAGQ